MSFRLTLDEVLSDPSDVVGAVAFARLNNRFVQTKFLGKPQKPKRPTRVKKPKKKKLMLTSVRSKTKRVVVSVSPRLTARKKKKSGGKK